MTWNLSEIYFRLREKHNYHLVDNSQLPLVAALASMLLVLNIVLYFHTSVVALLHFFENLTFDTAWFILTAVLFCWFFTVVLESGRGHHTLTVRQGLRYGMILFIVSEIMFFFAFFWAFFHVSLSPSVAIGGIWPPKSIQPLDVWGLPLLNTLLLLSSGLTITLAHRALLQAMNYTVMNKFNKHLLATIVLGIIFLCCQFIEYKFGITFRWKENVYGSTFFVTTGFHGLHVTIGTIFLLFCLIRNFLTASRSFESTLQQGAFSLTEIRDASSSHVSPFLKGLQEKFNSNQNLDKPVPQKRSQAWLVGQLILVFSKALWGSSLIYVKKLFQTKKNRASLKPNRLFLKFNPRPKKELLLPNSVHTGQEILRSYAMTKDQHLGFEAAAWYWHFVDVVWIFLFITIYWWGS